MSEEKDWNINSDEQAVDNSGSDAQPNFILQGTQETQKSTDEELSQQNNEVSDTQGTQPNFVMMETSGQETPINDSAVAPIQNDVGNQYNFWRQQSGDFQQSGPNFYNGQNFTFPNGAGQPMSEPVTKEKKEYPFLKKIGKGLAVGVVAGVGFCMVVFAANKLGIVENTVAEKSAGSTNSIAATVVTSGNTIDAPNDLTGVVDKCMPSIVSINSTISTSYGSFYGSQDSTGSGSGIILKISDDEILIVTNNHVIADAKKITVGFYGADKEKEMVEATVKGTDSLHDLAVVLVKSKNVPENVKKKICAAELGSSEDVKVGQMAVAIGNSLGYGQSLTVGYISAKNRTVEVEQGNMNLLQTDAAINPGNSGGALLDADGKVIGINSAKYADTSVEGMGFAIPITDAVPIINDLMKREVLEEEEKGYLGVSGTDITESVQQQYPNMPLGVYVSEVSKDGAAHEAGIVVGDIIVGVNDTEVLTIKDLAEKINSYRIGKKVTLKVKRYEKGKYINKKISVKLKGKESLNSLTDSEKKQNKNKSSNGNSDNDGNNSNGSNGQTNPYGNGGNSSGNNQDLEEFYRYFFGN